MNEGSVSSPARGMAHFTTRGGSFRDVNSLSTTLNSSLPRNPWLPAL